MFRNCISLKTFSLQNFNIQNVTTFAFMFHNCSSLIWIILHISQITNSRLKYINNMFSYCTNLSYIYLENLDFSKVENTESMFEGCSSLEEFQSPFYITKDDVIEVFMDITLRIPGYKIYYNINKVKFMKNMFKDCISLKRVNLTN